MLKIVYDYFKFILIVEILIMTLNKNFIFQNFTTIEMFIKIYIRKNTIYDYYNF